MSKFCGRCGAPLSADGKCKQCDKQKVKEAKKPAKAAVEQGAEKKKGKLWIKITAIAAAAVVLVCITLTSLVYFDVLNIPFVNQILISTGIKQPLNEQEAEIQLPDHSDQQQGTTDSNEQFLGQGSLGQSYEVPAIDAEAYFNQNGTVVSSVEVDQSTNVRTESDVCTELRERGFAEFEIYTSYSMYGEYVAPEEISPYSSEQHPMYETYFMTERGECWSVIEVNGIVMAMPLYHNLQSGQSPVIVSESESVMTYDSITNTFYQLIPNSSYMTVKTVARIDAQTLSQMNLGGSQQ